jgi:hypothetical protein
MRQNRFGEAILSESDLCDAVMQGVDMTALWDAVVEPEVMTLDLDKNIQDPGALKSWRGAEIRDISIEEFDRERQCQWFMPPEYQETDIAAHVIGLCDTPEQLQRVGQELLMYQERGLFDLLRYLRYLVDTMTTHNVIWGVGRGSSVASYVLYLLGVHRIDSLYYDLDPREFLR